MGGGEWCNDLFVNWRDKGWFSLFDSYEELGGGFNPFQRHISQIGSPSLGVDINDTCLKPPGRKTLYPKNHRTLQKKEGFGCVYLQGKILDLQSPPAMHNKKAASPGKNAEMGKVQERSILKRWRLR